MASSGPRVYMRREEMNILAVEAKTDKTASLRLWHEVERFADSVTYVYKRHTRSCSVLSDDDFMQCAYIGFLNAVRYFNPEKSGFLQALKYSVRSACWNEYYRMSKRPISTVSINRPVQGIDDEDSSIIDFLPDEAAEIAFETLLVKDIARLILIEAQSLNAIQARIIYECVYGGRTLISLAEEMGISKEKIYNHHQYAITRLRSRPIVKAIKAEFFAHIKETKLENMLNPHQTKGVKAFKTSFTSVVEDIVFKMVERAESKLEIPTEN